MTRLLTVALLLASSFLSTSAGELSGFVQWNEHCEDISQLGHAKVVLDNSIAFGSIARDGRFVIPEVDAGTYLVSVVSHDHVFDQIRVDVPPEPELPPEVRPYAVGTPLNPRSPVKLPYPIKLVPRHKKNYFVPHQSFNVMQMFQNPMMLIMVFGGLMMLAMPYITNLDPELVQEAQQNQAKFAKALQGGDLKSGLTALAGGDDGRPAITTGTSSQANSANAGAKSRAKKRRG
ncbi:hypothetical protein BC834DRAFT_5808 [Gloeopeniophorella convolvens]|nr:hypothetical protein BC834DRAFT_5808 [Gloeopeniophorella convolvens]